MYVLGCKESRGSRSSDLCTSCTMSGGLVNEKSRLYNLADDGAELVTCILRRETTKFRVMWLSNSLLVGR